MEAWQAEMRDISDRLTESCRAVDPASTDEVIQMAKAADVVAGETVVPTPPPEAPKEPEFGAGVFEGG